MNLPRSLADHREKLEKAFMLAVPAAWPEGEAYIDAEQPAAIGRALLKPLHEELLNARIAYLFKEDMKRGDQVRLATASKASSKLVHLADYDFVIDVNWKAWRSLGPEQRIALMDHELCHCTTDDKDAWAVRHHDVEEFGEIVRRWGLWKPDLTDFGKEVATAIGQGELFVEQVMKRAEKVLEAQDAAAAEDLAAGRSPVQLTP